MNQKKLPATFFRTAAGHEPVREFLCDLTAEDRKIIGTDIREVEFGWPLGMPLVRKMDADLWEIRSRIADGIVRVFITAYAGEMVLLHAFVKKSDKTPTKEITTAKQRLRQIRG